MSTVTLPFFITQVAAGRGSQNTPDNPFESLPH